MDLTHLDMDALVKGSIIPSDVLRKCVGCGPNHRAFAQLCLGVREAIMRHFQKERGQVVTVRFSNDTLEVLEDPESALYNSRSFRQGLAKSRRANRRLMGVDDSNLSDEARVKHARELEVQSRILDAVSRERSKARPAPVTRNVPGVPGR